MQWRSHQSPVDEFVAYARDYLSQGDMERAKGWLVAAQSVSCTDEERATCHAVANEIQRDICAQWIAQEIPGGNEK